MMSPVHITIPQADGSDRYVVIEPVLEKQDPKGLTSAGGYKIYQNNFGDDTPFITAPVEFDTPSNELPDDMNPDYLGKLLFKMAVFSILKAGNLALSSRLTLLSLSRPIRIRIYPPNFN
ncbi:hypothetical protein GCM10023149_28460 [Mucilaginibacter gynuensis]|uniref:Uncharacterized protein n=1 Tax=Mucilaginibacter gynuensis TaxID=1302236 RepID=A0ABP8GK86_9SPHI